MKKIVTLLLLFALSSCYVLKPDSSGSTNKDYNNKKEISNPKFVKKNNAIGISYQIISPLVAGAAMYQYVNPVVKYQDGTETKGFQPANAAIGVLGMLAVNKIMNFALGQNKEIPTTDKSIEKWMRKTELLRNNNFITENDGRKLIIIPKTNENDYEVKNIADVNYFKKLFPNASNENETAIIKKAIPVLEQEDLATLINNYPLNSACYAAKEKYVITSQFYEVLIQRKKLYQEVKFDFEAVSHKLIRNYKQLTEFNFNFPNSKYLKVAVLNAFNSSFPSTINEDFRRYIDNLNSTDLKYIGNNQKNNLLQFVLNNKTNSLADLESLIDNYAILINNENEKLVVDKYWEKLNKLSFQGDYLLNKMRQLGSNNEYSNWNISKTTVEAFLKTKLDYEVKNNVKISSINYISASSEDFEKWKTAEMTAGIINIEGAGKYIVYGTITNYSPYTLPVKINATGNLDIKYKIEGQDFWGKALTGLAKLGAAMSGQSGDPTIQTKRFGSLKESFYIQNLDKNTYAWAVLLDFSNIAKQIGFNFNDSVKAYSEFIFNNITTDVEFSSEGSISNEILKKQIEWQQYAQYGLPNIQLMDYWRKKEVSHEYWEKELEDKKERERLFREMQRKQEQFNKENSLVLDSNNSNYELKVFQEIEKQNTIQIYTNDNDDYNCCYSSIIYDKENNKIKEFSNNGNDDNSRDDNFVNINSYDFPVRVDVEYLHNHKEYVTFSVALTKGAEIIVKPKKK